MSYLWKQGPALSLLATALLLMLVSILFAIRQDKKGAWQHWLSQELKAMVSVLKFIVIWVGICYLQIPLAAVFVWAYPRQSAWRQMGVTAPRS